MDNQRYIAMRRAGLVKLATEGKPKTALGLALQAATQQAMGLATEAIRAEARAHKAADAEIRRIVTNAEQAYRNARKQRLHVVPARKR